MPEIVSEIVFSVRAVSGSDVTATVSVQGSDADDVIATATIDGTAGEAAQAGASQRVNMAVKVDGDETSPSHLLGGSEVSRTYEAIQQSGKFAVPIGAGGAGLFGDPWDKAGPPTGKKTISIFGVYETSTGRHLVPIITDGITDTSSRSDQGGYTESFEFADRGARFDRKKVTVLFPPGHGLGRHEVAEHILVRAGEDRSRLEPMNQMMKELPLSKAEPTNEVQSSLMDIEHRRLLWDREGYPINPQVGPFRSNEPVAWSFNSYDILDTDAVNVRHIADVITKVIATGNAQELLGPCELISDPPQSFRTDAIYAPHRPAYLQNSSSSYTGQTPETIGENPILVELKILETTRRCEQVVRTRTLVYSWKNTERSRYKWDETGEQWVTIANVYTEDNTDDESPAYTYAAERWALTSIEDLRDYYFENGFNLQSYTPGQYPELVNLLLPKGASEIQSDPSTGKFLGPLAGVKLGSHRLTYSYYAPRTAVKERDVTGPPDEYLDWQEVNPDDEQEVLGNKEAAQVMTITNASKVRKESLNLGRSGEYLILTKEEIEILQPTENGRFLASSETHTHGWDVRPGGVKYFYNEDLFSNELNETYRKVRIDTATYVGVGEDLHNVIRTSYDRDGREVDGLEDEFNQPGWLPAMDRLPDTAPDESLYESEGDVIGKAREALRTDQRQMRIELEGTDLLAWHEENEVEANLEWAENEDELEFAARMMIAESAVAQVTFTLAGFNAFVQECDRIHLTYSPLGLDHDLRVKTVSHSGGYPDGPLLTKLDCVLYGWD